MTRITKAQIPLVKQKILERQNFKCELCSIDLVVATGCLDHDHITGRIRGVLCRNCNGIEGKINNLTVRARRGAPKTHFLGKVILYWQKHETDRTGLLHPIHLTEDEKRIKRNEKARKARAAKKGK